MASPRRTSTTHSNVDLEQPPLDPDRGSDAVKDGSPEYLTGIPMWNLFAAIYLAMFLLGLDAAIVATAIPTMTAYFKTIADINWYGSAYLLTL
ncbi:MAG: hypothetical protein Q9190_000223 [Brigantiaea leucoxantha]